MHDPGKIILDLAVCVALGGRCLSDVALLRCQGEVFGPVASDPTVCRLVGILADHVEAVEAAVNRARTVVRQRAWALAGVRDLQDATGISIAKIVRELCGLQEVTTNPSLGFSLLRC